jgi:hypothetical protein
VLPNADVEAGGLVGVRVMAPPTWSSLHYGVTSSLVCGGAANFYGAVTLCISTAVVCVAWVVSVDTEVVDVGFGAVATHAFREPVTPHALEAGLDICDVAT